jgi:transcriptional regulator with XRE-family HTH domain/tetratricopeptide (TPR) repeat protein
VGQRRADLTPDASPWHKWGARLRHHRDACSLSLEQLGARVHVSRSYLSKLERGLRPVPQQIATACDRALELDGTLIRMWEDAASTCASTESLIAHVSSPVSTVSRLMADLESLGLGQETSDGQNIPLLCRLQDGRIAFVTVPRRVFLRAAAALGTATTLGPTAARTLGDPVALTPPRRARLDTTYAATPVEHFRSLRRLLIDSDNLLGPRQVLPTVHENIALIRSLRRDSSGSDRRDLLELQTQFAEFASWLHQDLGDHASSQFWLDRALQWSHTLGDDDLTCYVMARKAQLAGEMMDRVDVVDLAEAAQHLARPKSRLAVMGQTYGAYGHAIRGEGPASEDAFAKARETVEDTASDPTPWGLWLDVNYVEVHRAQGLAALGHHDKAANAYAGAIKKLPVSYHRDRGVYLAREAVAHAGAGVPEQAASVGLQALGVAEDTGSGRIFDELARLDGALRPWQQLAEVTEFRAALDDIALQEA